MKPEFMKIVTGGAEHPALRPGTVLYERQSRTTVTIGQVREGGVIGVYGELILRPLAEHMRVVSQPDGGDAA